ncbi:MAG TPA: DUF763 domain-containing protein [Planctomycetaceae bacterium]|nr:DUF763 domain-containing protein [Planctomycetaceae bacterium]
MIYQAPSSSRDPAAGPPRHATVEEAEQTGATNEPERRWADYSYAHGGKDGTPFPVDRRSYDRNIAVLLDAVRRARMGQNEKVQALKRLANLGG